MNKQDECYYCPHNTNPTDAATVEQQQPAGTGADVAYLVQSDIERRARIGERKYGERLKSHNGRIALIDAYQEALDLAMYLRQMIEERK